MSRAFALGIVALLAVLGPVRPAAAATLAPLKPCYVSAGPEDAAREKVGIVAQGLTPNGAATVLLDGGLVLGDAQIDQSGTVSGGVAVPYLARGQRPFTLTVTDNANPANTVSAQALVTALTVDITPADARPSSRVRFRGRGFTGGAAVYGHYLRKGRVRKTVRLAAPRGDCGTFDVRRRQLPFRRPGSGRWTLQIDQEPVWSANPASVRVTFAIDVTRSSAGPGPSASS